MVSISCDSLLSEDSSNDGDVLGSAEEEVGAVLSGGRLSRSDRRPLTKTSWWVLTFYSGQVSSQCQDHNTEGPLQLNDLNSHEDTGCPQKVYHKRCSFHEI